MKRNICTIIYSVLLLYTNIIVAHEHKSVETIITFTAFSAEAGYINADDEESLQLIKRLYEQGKTKEAGVAARNLLKKATKEGSIDIRIAAFEVVLATQTNKVKTLKDALKDNDIVYRNAALEFASGYADKVMYTELLKFLSKVENVAKIDILNWIGSECQQPDKKEIMNTIETGIDRTGLQTMIQQLDNDDINVKKSAAKTIGHLGDNAAIPVLANLLKSKDKTVVSITKEVLSSFDGNISPALANIMSIASDEGKMAALELLSLRKADAYFYVVLEQANNGSPEVKKVAYNTLKNVVSQKDIILLCGMLETSEQSFVLPLQQAIVSAVSSMKPEERTKIITTRMLHADEVKKHLYDPVLSAMNDPNDLECP